MFEQVEIDDNLKINRSMKIKTFINSCLDDLNLGFRVGLENKKYEDGTDSQYYIFGIQHKLKDSKGKPTSKEFGDLVPIADVGMGNASIVSIIGSLYRFSNVGKRSGHTIILREPETYLHPEWIEKMVRFLYDFIVGDNSKNLKLIIETHNETVLRTTQLIMKEKPEEYKDTIGAYFLLNKDDGKGTIIKDLEIKSGFLAQKIESGFFSTNTDLISDLWNEDE